MKATKIILNGSLVGFFDDPEKFIQEFKENRRKQLISDIVNIGYKEDSNEIYINTHSGRIQRPLIVIKNGKPLLTQRHIDQLKSGKIKFSDLVKDGIIEYLDADEEDNAYVVSDSKKITSEHTHLEIDSIVLFSLMVSMIPYFNHDLATKVLHGAKMFKQGIGYYASNNNLKTDTESYMLYYPQRHLVKTKTIDMIHADDRGFIQNFVVAIMPYYGFNMYDAVVINKGAVQRGLGRLSYYRTYKDYEMLYPGGQKDVFRPPTEEEDGYLGDDAYKIIGIDNLPEVEQFADKDTALIAKVSPPKFTEELKGFGLVEEKFVGNSTFVKKNMEGWIDKVFVMSSGDQKIVKIKTRTLRLPENGDKFSSKHGQKGVVGLIAEERDMPMSTRGVVPDLLLNPHSVPSRMTIGDLIELLGGKAAAMSMEQIDGTAFSSVPIEKLKEILKENGFRPDGYEVFYDGISGRPILGEIYTGMIAYRRLYFLVKHSIQARARGPVQILTRQPTEGKEKEGGLKFGEMESDCLVGYGAAMLLNEKLVEDSDKVILPVCRQCGIIAIDDKIQGRRYCPACGGTDIANVSMPYSFKLFLEELRAMVIYPKIIIEE